LEDQPPLPLYTYKKLRTEDSIRVLTLCGATAEEITCTIQEIQLAHHRPYQALSYVWGPPATPHYAVVQGEDGTLLGCIPLTTNVYHALHDLWHSEELQLKVFWIDQICIDQSAKDEKGHQVVMMGRIYKRASRVITYLGPAEDDELERKGIELLDQIYRHFEPNHERFEQLAGLDSIRASTSELPVRNLPESLLGTTEEKTWAWLTALAFGDFATRLWIVQEQVLNEQIVMLRGSRLLSWDAVAILGVLYYLEFIPRNLTYDFWHSTTAAGMSDLWNIAGSLCALWKIRRMVRQDPCAATAFPLLRNLGDYVILRCEDPRDRIFALLAISGDADELGITPDYSQPISQVTQVFHQTSVAILKKRADLYLLVLACWCNNLFDPACPSWAYNIPRPVNLQSIGLAYNVCCPHPTVRARPRLGAGCSVLVLKGSIVGCVVFCTSQLLQTTSSRLGILNAEWVETMVKRLFAWSQILLRLGVTLGVAGSLCRALIADPFWTPSSTTAGGVDVHVVYHLWCYLRYYAWYVTHIGRSPNAETVAVIACCQSVIDSIAALLSDIGVTFTRAADPLSPAEDAAATEVWNRVFVAGRTFCVTEQDRICNCMNEVKEGDVIAAFEGADRLYVLRPVGNQYQLIGDAYVDGLMKGEAYEGLDPDEVDYDIELI
jgi:hypothetical protein